MHAQNIITYNVCVSNILGSTWLRTGIYSTNVSYWLRAIQYCNEYECEYRNEQETEHEHEHEYEHEHERYHDHTRKFLYPISDCSNIGL